ncbi:hypothetical protein OPKNFCMD_1611 [Methylobacterium crusticola]|uniref:Acyl-CoA thioesterase n=1 Tax=Methylobacterium crusticola TaxID=1697972 RepID=A0ABQ4QU70_9HYPH|nr:hypothetical protein OPKNFCMD_1611 [Methylobacterium crusticola]
MWGLGFFYAIHVTLTYGWLGFLAFAVPNAVGLGLFGWFLGAPGRDPAKIFAAVETAYTGLFLLCQLGAVSITLFGIVAYLWLPLTGSTAALGVVLLMLVACSIGHSLEIGTLRLLHAAYLVVGVAAALAALAGMPPAPGGEAPPLAAFDARFYGLALPTLVGFLLGPWMDVQQWQRAVAIHREGGSVRAAYGIGAALFLGLLVLNAALAAAAGTGGTVVSADGLPGAQPAVALALARDGLGPAALAYVLWALVAAASTIDGFYCATRWLMTSVTRRSASPLLAFVPAGLVASPLWLALGAVAVAFAAVAANLSLMYLMLPYATLLVGAAACLVCETFGAPRRYDPVLCLMIGLAASLVFLQGYVAPVGALLALAPLLGLVGALPMIAALVRPAPPGPPARGAAPEEVTPLVPAVALATQNAIVSHGFDGHWFVLHLVPTYDDTNSVGNVYFANYVRWVGKARELFFSACMPDFDLRTTEYYVLTRSFSHDFRREIKEFEHVTVRVRIARHNRKFVTLAHEIFSDSHGLLGRGEQSLMFVDTVQYRPLDIPRAIIAGFLPYWPRESPHAGDVAAPGTPPRVTAAAEP